VLIKNKPRSSYQPPSRIIPEEQRSNQ